MDEKKSKEWKEEKPADFHVPFLSCSKLNAFTSSIIRDEREVVVAAHINRAQK
jgi:hypothetical protein